MKLSLKITPFSPQWPFSRLATPLLYVALLWAGISPAAAQSQNETDKEADGEPVVAIEKDLGESIPPINVNSALLREMLTAEIRAQRGESLEAAQTYMQLGRATSDSRFARRATQWLLQIRNFEQAFEAAQLWVTQAPQSIDAGKAFDALAMASGKYDALGKVLDTRLAGARKSNALAAAYDKIVRTLSAAPNKSAANELLMNLTTRDQERVEGRFARSEWQVLQRNWAGANLEIEQALALAPNDQRALWLGVQIAAGLKDGGLVMQRATNYQGQPNSKLPSRAIALLGAGQMLEEQRKFADAQQLISLIEAKDENHFASRLKYSQLEAKKVNPEAGLAQLAKIDGSTPEQKSQLIRIGAQIMRDADRHQDAIKILGDGLRSMPDNPELLYEHALAAEKIKDYVLMEKQLRRLIELKPEDSLAYNALGYSFADRNVRLDDAEQLLREALRLSPDSGAILDSLGWALFRKGRYNEAIDYLRNAFQRQPDGEVAAHLGEAFWAIGQRETAIQMWRAAAKEFSDHPVLKETMQRYNVTPNHIQ
jgi:tetratricopeptide (TPR) repeat protein